MLRCPNLLAKNASEIVIRKSIAVGYVDARN